MNFRCLVIRNFSEKFLFFLTFILLIIIICVIKTSYNRKMLATMPIFENSTNIIKDSNVSTPFTSELEKATKQQTKKVEIISNLPSDFKGYKLSALLEIPKIELSTYVLDEYSENSLNTSVVKLTGPDPNQIGNFCIIGHNYNKSNMFSKLKKLEIGDKIFLTDNLNRKVEYEIYLIDKVAPKDLECISQETEYNKEVTLITCTTGALKRLIIKSNAVIYD